MDLAIKFINVIKIAYHKKRCSSFLDSIFCMLMHI